MPKKSWASKEQQDWLYAQLPNFRIAQEAKTTPSFFSNIFQEFHAKWPVPSPTAKEIAADDGSQEQAQTTKEKASESVSDSFLVSNLLLLSYTCQRIHYWVYNKSRGSSSGTGTRGVLPLKSNPRLLQPWQAFAKLFGEELKSRVDTEWQEYQEANPGETYTKNDRFNFHNKKMQEWYDESESEAKEQVEEFRSKYKEGSVEGDDDENPNVLLQR
jgi:hypothetical protein